MEANTASHSPWKTPARFPHSQTSRTDPHPFPPSGFQPLFRKWPQLGHFLQITIMPACVQPRKELSQKYLIRIQGQEVAATPHHQRLIGCLLEAVVTLFDVAILIGLSGLYLLPNQPVMSQQTGIGARELLGIALTVHGRAHPVRSML